MVTPKLAQDIAPEDVQWLWRERIPRGMFSMIAGKPDQGKSMMAAHIAADVTREGGTVLYSSAERPFSIVERPRLQAAGAVLSRVRAAGPGTGYRFTLPADMDALAEQIVEFGIDLLVMDPVSAHFSGVAPGSDKIRDILTPFADLISQTGTAVLFIEHALKRVAPHADPLSAVRGNSSGIPAACAMGFLFGSDPLHKEQKVLANVKANICEQPTALQFEIDEVEIGMESPYPVLKLEEELSGYDAIRLIARPEQIGRPDDKRKAAEQWLIDYLAAAGEPIKSSTIKDDALAHDISARTLRRAAVQVGIVKEGNGPAMTWWLPDDVLANLAEVEFRRHAPMWGVGPASIDWPTTYPTSTRRAWHVLRYIDANFRSGERAGAIALDPKAPAKVDEGLSFTDDELNEFLRGLE